MKQDDLDRIRLLDALAGNDAYDPACERAEVAIRAIWLLYRRAKWDLLALTGIPRADFEPIFSEFALDVGYRLTDLDTHRLVLVVRDESPRLLIRLLSAAYWLIGKYRQRKLTGYGVVITTKGTDQ